MVKTFSYIYLLLAPLEQGLKMQAEL